MHVALAILGCLVLINLVPFLRQALIDALSHLLSHLYDHYTTGFLFVVGVVAWIILDVLLDPAVYFVSVVWA